MIKNVKNAQNRIKNHIAKTQVILAEKLSKKYGGNIYLKLENTQISGSFKIRGAINKIFSMKKSEIKNGVIAASAGNHAQGVAAGAKLLGIKSTIIMPVHAPISKIKMTIEYGGNVILHGENFDEAMAYALKLAEEKKLQLIHPFDDDKVIEGQGTIGLEIFKEVKNIDQVIVPIGGGGLIAGIASTIKELNPKIKIIGVQTKKVHPVLKSFIAKKYKTQKSKTTIADGIAVGKPGRKTIDLILKHVDQIVTVDEDDIYKAILFLIEKCKVVAEGAGCVSVAAIMNGKIKTKNKNTVGIISGGNIDVTMMQMIINKGLMNENRRFELKINVPNRAGELLKIFNIISEEKGSVFDVKSGYYRASMNPTQQAVTIVVDVIENKYKQNIINKINKISDVEFISST